MIAENTKDRQSENQSSEFFSQKTKDEISLLDSKVDELIFRKCFVFGRIS